MIKIILKKIFSSITSRIILANLFVFILVAFLSLFFSLEQLFNLIGLTPSLILSGSHLWTLLTNMFMHANIWHLIFNMISLSFIGLFAEKIIGKKRFFWFYIISGIFASIFFAVFAYFFGVYELGAKIFGSPDILGVGASGAIFGLIGLIAILTPKNRVYLVLGPLIAIIIDALLGSFVSTPLAIVISTLVNIYILISVFFMFSFNPRKRRWALPVEMPFWLLPIVAIVPLTIIGLFVDLPIGNSAHLGGLIAGLAYGIYLKVRYPQKTKLVAKYFSR